MKSEDVQFPAFSVKDFPQFRPSEVWLQLTRLNTSKSTVPGDFPARLSKHFAAYLAEPLTDIINTSIRRGEYPRIYKNESCTPVPKSYPLKTTSDVRNISGLFTFDKIMEKLISELMIADMKPQMDRSQYGNKRGLSIQHYLIKMLHRILTELDKNGKNEKWAVILNMIDWETAFPRQCPKLGIDSFIRNGVRPSLIPLLVNFFQDRKMSVKWKGCRSTVRDLNGGGPAGATFGLLEYLSQSNNFADMVNEDDRFRFLDDLSLLEIVNLLSVGLSSFNFKQTVASDIPLHNQFVKNTNLKSQDWLDQINAWTKAQKMKINAKKSSVMIFNYTRDYQFATRLSLNNESLEIASHKKLLGTIISNDLSWDLNTAALVKNANLRLQLLRKVASFGSKEHS